MKWDGRIRADARAIPLADSCVQCIVTSPPYWGLRDYSMCSCRKGRIQHESSTMAGSQAGTPSEFSAADPDCQLCAGTGHNLALKSSQIGLERTPQEYVDSIRSVFLDLWRVLKDDGACWLNLGDSYAGSFGAQSKREDEGFQAINIDRFGSEKSILRKPRYFGLKPKDLVGIPWRVAFALQADGWYLRSDIIWAKPNPMPESVTDRPTKAHEYIFLLTKNEKYYYDQEAIKEECVKVGTHGHLQHGNGPGRYDGYRDMNAKHRRADPQAAGHRIVDSVAKARAAGAPHDNPFGDTRNKRSVWTVPTSPYPEAHYAAFPEEIPDICIRAGSRAGDLILDPFFGSGTVGRVAERLNRRWVGLDLGYQDLQAKRVSNVQKELLCL